MHRTRSHVADEVAACIGCGECLAACPALDEPLPIETLNHETVDGPDTAPVARFAANCYLCGACVPVCPVGLHRDAMMLWLKMRLLGADHVRAPSEHRVAWRSHPYAAGGTRDMRVPTAFRRSLESDTQPTATPRGGAARAGNAVSRK